MGTSLLPFGNLYYLRDHPHAYGDKKRITLCMALGLGSSPRVWGQALVKPLCCAGKRIIPTRMGTRDTHDGVCFPDRDHPHAYGDKNIALKECSNEWGSSPRVWGQDDVIDRNKNPVRIIPTRMGTSRKYAKNHKQQKDHPHAYGDKNQVQRNGLQYIGSSPRVWGQVFKTISKRSNSRIIPTRMGTSKNRSNENSQRQDHPHAYGDKCLRLSVNARTAGSSPRVWGQAKTEAMKILKDRIIPTRMGTSSSGSILLRQLEDHPHAYGDKYVIIVCFYPGIGSSPRVWGQEGDGSSNALIRRIIPTRMGTSHI